MTLNPEEQFLWDCARLWRTPAQIPLPSTLDWPRTLAIDTKKRMRVLLHRILQQNGRLTELPTEIQEVLEVHAAWYGYIGELMGNSLGRFLQETAVSHIPVVVLKGLWVSVKLYGDPAIRPGGDIDILVHPHHVAACLDILQQMGVGQNDPRLLADAYYQRHHLHLQRCTQDREVWYELHWALEHPTSLLTLDYPALMARTTTGTLFGAPVQELSLPDLLLTLAQHYLKHAVYLSTVLERPDLPRILLADDMFVPLLDIAEVMKVWQADIDWEQTVQLAQAWGMGTGAGAVFRACHRLLEAPVPAWVLAALPVQPPGWVTRVMMHKTADYRNRVYLGGPPSWVWDFLLTAGEGVVVRPIRLLEMAGYCFPGQDFLRRRYGQVGWRTAVFHLFRAIGQYGQAVLDAVYYTWKQNHEPF